MIKLMIEYDPQTRNIQFGWDDKFDIFGKHRDLLYIMLARTHEELLLQLTNTKERSAPGPVPSENRSFGKGRRTDVDRV